MRKFLLVAIAAAIVLASPVRRVLAPAFYDLAAGHFAQFQQHLQSLGPWGPVMSIVLMIAGALAVPVPVTFVMIANGLVFGTWLGAVVSFVGAMLGALCAYIIGRSFSLGVLERFLPAASFRATAEKTVRYVSWAVVLERWIPGVPCDPMSYAAGCTRMPVSSFLLLTTIGLLPACVVTAYLGERAANDVPMYYWLPGLLVVGAVWAMWLGWLTIGRRRGSAT